MSDRESTLKRARCFDLFDPELREDPYALYEGFREHCPVAHSEAYGGYWILSTYEDVFHALRNPAVFSSRTGAGLMSEEYADPERMIPIGLDPPEHSKYRRILAEHFSLPKMRELEPEIRAVASRRLESIAEAGGCEFVEEFAIPLPAEIFLRLMGLPYEEAPKFLGWVHQITREGTSADEEAEKRTAEETRPAINAFFQGAIDRRRRETQQPDDVLGLLLTARLDGKRLLTDNEMLKICMLLLLGGLDTTASSLSSAIAYLATHPEKKREIVEDPRKIPAAVEELLRYESIVSQLRVVKQEVVVRGTTLHPGDRVLMLPGSAGRDPEKFPNPDRVDFGRREASQHLAFGAGPHRCLGMHLARLELSVALEEIHRCIPSYRIPEGATVQRHHGFVRGVDRLPLELVPGSRR